MKYFICDEEYSFPVCSNYTKCLFLYRNDLYLTLNSGEFERGGKSVGKNIEVTVLALDAEGYPLEVRNCYLGLFI